MSSSKNKIPDVPGPASSTGNILSSVAPPSELPNFVTASPVKTISAVPPINPQHVPPSVPPQVEQKQQNLTGKQPTMVQQTQPAEPGQQSPDKFSPVIPLCKGEPTQSIRSPQDSLDSQTPDSLTAITPDVDKLGDIMPGSGLFTWVKGAVSTGGLLQQVVEKAKNSVDTMITTLDPQMKEYLLSGGDIHLVVASDKEIKISPVREAFQAVFGKSTVVGYPAQSEVTAAQPVGYAAAYAAAKQRIAYVRANNTAIHNNVPVLAVESFIYEAISDRWYEVGLLVLSHAALGIELHMVSQGACVPTAAVLAAQAATPADYPHAQTGYAVTIGSIMGPSLQVPHTQWHEASSAVSRREVLLLAARSLAGSYKKMLAVSASEEV